MYMHREVDEDVEEEVCNDTVITTTLMKLTHEQKERTWALICTFSEQPGPKMTLSANLSPLEVFHG